MQFEKKLSGNMKRQKLGRYNRLAVAGGYFEHAQRSALSVSPAEVGQVHVKNTIER